MSRRDTLADWPCAGELPSGVSVHETGVVRVVALFDGTGSDDDALTLDEAARPDDVTPANRLAAVAAVLVDDRRRQPDGARVRAGGEEEVILDLRASAVTGGVDAVVDAAVDDAPIPGYDMRGTRRKPASRLPNRCRDNL